jgi:hypothetical protein
MALTESDKKLHEVNVPDGRRPDPNHDFFAVSSDLFFVVDANRRRPGTSK